MLIRPMSRHSSVRPSNATPDRAETGGFRRGRRARGRRGALGRLRLVGLLPPQEVQWHPALRSSVLQLLSRISSTTPAVGERRRVAERSALGDVAEEAAHDLAGARLRQVRA
jgi:hypothetical protein